MSKFYVDVLNEYSQVSGIKEVRVLGFVPMHQGVLAVVSDGVGALEAIDIKHVKEMTDGHERMDAAVGTSSDNGAARLSSLADEGVATGLRQEEEGSDSSSRSTGAGRARPSKPVKGSR